MIWAAPLRIPPIAAVISWLLLSSSIVLAAEPLPTVGFRGNRLVVVKPVRDESIEQVVVKDLDGDGIPEYIVALESNASARHNPHAAREVGDVLTTLVVGHRQGAAFKVMRAVVLGDPEAGGSALQDLAVLDLGRNGAHQILVQTILGAHTYHLQVFRYAGGHVELLWETSSPGGIAWGFDARDEFRVSVSQSPYVPGVAASVPAPDTYVYRNGQVVHERVAPSR